jgi:hypothetical protein
MTQIPKFWSLQTRNFFVLVAAGRSQQVVVIQSQIWY